MWRIKNLFGAFTLIELLVVIAIIAILAGMLLPILARAREEARRSVCSNQMGQLGKAQQAYMNTNDDFWAFMHFDLLHDGGDNQGIYRHPQGDIPAPRFGGNRKVPHDRRLGWEYNQDRNPYDVNAHFPDSRGNRNRNPNVSLSILYPRWIDDINVFACPSTADQPIIGKWQPHEQGPEYSWFFSSPAFDCWATGGQYQFYAPNPDDDLTGGGNVPAVKVTRFAGGAPRHMPSYGYDDRKHPRRQNPGSARMADMPWYGGRVWPGEGGAEHFNHAQDGHNVLYWDGSVQFRDTNYASVNPQDNIFADDSGIPLDEDAQLRRTHHCFARP